MTILITGILITAIALTILFKHIRKKAIKFSPIYHLLEELDNI
jgi:hypothetical protein